MPTSPTFKAPGQFIDRNESAKTSISGYNPSIEQPKVDLFKQYGGYGGLIGLQGPLAPGSYKLSDLLGTPTVPKTPVVPQYSKEQATQNLAQQLAGIANQGGSLPSIPVPQNQSPLSPANTVNNKKGMPSQ